MNKEKGITVCPIIMDLALKINHLENWGMYISLLLFLYKIITIRKVLLFHTKWSDNRLQYLGTIIHAK